MLIIFVQVFVKSKFVLKFENHSKIKIKIQAFVHCYQFKGKFKPNHWKFEKQKLANIQLFENVKRPYIWKEN